MSWAYHPVNFRRAHLKLPLPFATRLPWVPSLVNPLMLVMGPIQPSSVVWASKNRGYSCLRPDQTTNHWFIRIQLSLVLFSHGETQSGQTPGFHCRVCLLQIGEISLCTYLLWNERLNDFRFAPVSDRLSCILAHCAFHRWSFRTKNWLAHPNVEAGELCTPLLEFQRLTEPVWENGCNGTITIKTTRSPGCSLWRKKKGRWKPLQRHFREKIFLVTAYFETYEIVWKERLYWW